MQAELFETRSHDYPQRKLGSVRVAGKSFRVTPVFHAYWKFAAERHLIFRNRLQDTWPVTNDPILLKFKFTNAYRVLDRTSQYLIGEVIQKGDQDPVELFYRILLFKLFNKIETWELLQRNLGEVRFSTHRFDHFDHVLSDALSRKQRIYSAAYIMPSGGANGDKKKHRSHLKLLETMIEQGVPKRLQKAGTMEEGFKILLAYPMIGNFLAYQFVTDLNYSELTDYSEREFVIPGPGAMDGLKKCFPDMVPSEASSLIRFMCDHQESLQQELGLRPVSLCGRPLQLIDCQNLFCETDKYSRVAFPRDRGSVRENADQAIFPRDGSTSASRFPVEVGPQHQ